MTQPTDRPGIDQLTSDGLDQLYARIDTLSAVCKSNKQAYVGAVKDAMAAEERAEKAEAAIERVTSLVRHYEQWGLTGWQPSSVYPSQVAREFRAVLDQHGQTPA